MSIFLPPSQQDLWESSMDILIIREAKLNDAKDIAKIHIKKDTIGKVKVEEIRYCIIL